MSWKTRKLGEICEVIAGQSPEGRYYNEAGKGIPFYQGKKLFGERNLEAPNVWTTKATKLAEPGDILISVRAPVGAINITNQKICIGRGLTAIRCKDEVERDYLFYFLLKIQATLRGTAGAVFNSINKTQIECIEIQPPPIREQILIVKKLDAAFADIGQAISVTNKNAKNAGALFQSYMNSVFKQEGENWIRKPLGNACIVERGSSPRPIKKFLTEEPDGVNWIKIGDTVEGEKYVVSSKGKIISEGAKKSRFVKKGDLILTNSMSYGRPYIMHIDGYIHDGWFVLRLNNEIDANYFYYLLSSNFTQTQFKSLAAGSVVKNISSDLLKRTIVIIPPTEKQKKIADNLEAASLKTKNLNMLYKLKIKNLLNLKSSILTQAFTGELTEDAA